MAETVKPLLPFDPLPAGTPTAQFYLVINLNSFRSEVVAKPALSFEAAQPGSPADRDLYVLDGDWGLTFQDEDGNPVDGDGLLAYYTSGTWYYFTPVVGLLKRIGANYYVWESTEEWAVYNPAGAVTSVNGATGAVVVPVPIQIAVSDETTDLTTGTGKVTFRMPFAMTLTAVRASVGTAPTGAALQVDINEGGVSILSTPITIDAGEKTSTTAATPPVISDTTLADDAEITIDIDQIGSTVAGKGLKVSLIGYKTP